MRRLLLHYAERPVVEQQHTGLGAPEWSRGIGKSDMGRRSGLAAAVVGVVVLSTGGTGFAQAPAESASSNFPTRAVRLIVPFPPGGPTDLMARVYGQKLGEEWGQPVIIENRPGGNSALGAQQVARSAPDGYTLPVAMDTTLVMNPITTDKLPYDALKDFAPISLTAQNTSLLIVRADDAPRTVPELIAKARANPGKMNYGAGTITTRLAGHLFSRLAGLDTVFIPYKGSAEVVQGLLTASIDFSVDGISASLPLIRSGKLRALAKLNSRPLAALPELQPLSVAAGLPALGDISTWAGLVAPSGTPAPIIDRIQRSVARAAADPEVQSRLGQVGIAAVSMTPVEFGSYAKGELDRWSAIFRDSGIKLD
jgi:tripartite-type tricarboxylate transporter receptor subunit TctC